MVTLQGVGMSAAKMNPEKKFLVYISNVKTASCIWSSAACALTYDYVKARATDDSRYTFSAKEKDDETQYSYFGARYYDSDLSVWLSVDPMSDKYPNLSPYAYCANNPVMLVDPNGMEVITEVHRYKTNKDGSERELNKFSFRRADRIDVTHTVRDMKIYDGTGKESDETMTNAATEIQNEITDYWNTSNKEGADKDGYITNKRGQKLKVSTTFENNIEVVKDFSSLKSTDNIIHVISGNDMYSMIGSTTGMTLEGGARGSNIIYTTGYHLTPGSFDGAFAHEWGHSLGLDDVRIYRIGAENSLMYNSTPTIGRGPEFKFDAKLPRPSYQEFKNSRYSTPTYFPPNLRYQ
ncbi:hypothetical protein SDC9_65778 [bioreactor metagenome]|uniref:RHS repeat-associated core domain-containing protein n=1 Tax=bioreactor metagenome TaxID=1076179 RepID=A0A644XT62_9ZZZZ